MITSQFPLLYQFSLNRLGQARSIRRPGNCFDPSPVTLKGEDFVPAGGLPHLYLLQRSGGKKLPIWRPRQSANPVGMSSIRQEDAPSHGFPDTYTGFRPSSTA